MPSEHHAEMLEQLVRESLTVALPQLEPGDRDAAIAAVLGLLVSVDDQDQGARYAMITLLATPCRHCGAPILWEPMGQDWTHYHGPQTCHQDDVASHDSPAQPTEQHYAQPWVGASPANNGGYDDELSF